MKDYFGLLKVIGDEYRLVLQGKEIKIGKSLIEITQFQLSCHH